jgi:hypothetical protein
MEGSSVYPADAVILARADGFRHGCGPVAGFGPIRCSIGPSGQFTWHNLSTTLVKSAEDSISIQPLTGDLRVICYGLCPSHRQPFAGDERGMEILTQE